MLTSGTVVLSCDTFEYQHQSFGVDDALAVLENSDLGVCCEECRVIADCWAYSLNVADMRCTLFNFPLNISVATPSSDYISGTFNSAFWLSMTCLT